MVDPNTKKVGQRGFTIIELLVVIFIVFILAMLTIPTILEVIYKSKMQSTNRLATTLAQNARYRAIKRRVPCGVHTDSTTNIVTAFLDTDGNGAYTVGADEILSTYEFPRYIGYDSPAGPVFDGMNTDGTEHWVMFDPDGSLDPVGAFRYGDNRGNFFEVRFGPAATGKVQVRKYNDSVAVNHDGTKWWGNAEGVPWEWY